MNLSRGWTTSSSRRRDLGELKLIVCRPDVDQRKVVEKANLDKEQGLIGDNWLARGSSATEDGSAHPEMQLNIMNARVAELVAGGTERMPLAGDQLYLDLRLEQREPVARDEAADG